MASTPMHDLAKERKLCPFDPYELACFLYDGPERLRRKRFIEGIAAGEADLQHKPFCLMNRSEVYGTGIKKMLHVVSKIKELGLTDDQDKAVYTQMAFPYETPPMWLHRNLFIPHIASQGTEEQAARWTPRAEEHVIIGTYAQTELGHGTFIRGLETTATYDPVTQMFDLHSPTLTSMKWWPGNLGRTVNHCTVMAQLITGGKSRGVHFFVVQVRDIETHRLMPGVMMGDIGRKFGMGTSDNGYARFDHVKIPRDNMLMRWAEVQQDGTYVSKGSPILMYGSMVSLRARIVLMASHSLSGAVTIATRYSAARRQTEGAHGVEPQVLDYQTQLHKLLPEVATAYALRFAGDALDKQCKKVQAEIEAGNVSSVQDLHGLAACMKAFSTWHAAYGVERVRQACGGHGYLESSGLPKIFVAATPLCTAEGENTVMMLQTARILVKSLQKAMSGKPLPKDLNYLMATPTGVTSGGVLSLDDLVSVFQQRAASLVQNAAAKMQGDVGAGRSPAEAWNNNTQRLVRAADAHAHQYVVTCAVERVRSGNLGQATRAALTQIAELYALHGLVQNSGDFLISDILRPEAVRTCEDRLLSLLASLRTSAVGLVDGFDFHDHVLQSALGRYDGNVYEALYDAAKMSTLNDTEVHESFEKYIKPFMEHKSKL